MADTGCESCLMDFNACRDLLPVALEMTAANINLSNLNDSQPFELHTVMKLDQYRQHLSNAHLNTQSISLTFAQFEAMLNTHQFDIITLSETWLKDNTYLLNAVDIPGYHKGFRNLDRVKGGGVGYYVKTDINVKERKDLTNLN